MTKRHVLILLAILAAIFLGVITLAKGEHVPCFDIAAAVTAAEKEGGYLIALVDIPGEGADQLLVVTVGGLVAIAGARDGCMVTEPVVLMRAKSKGEPA